MREGPTGTSSFGGTYDVDVPLSKKVASQLKPSFESESTLVLQSTVEVTSEHSTTGLLGHFDTSLRTVYLWNSIIYPEQNSTTYPASHLKICCYLLYITSFFFFLISTLTSFEWSLFSYKVKYRTFLYRFEFFLSLSCSCSRLSDRFKN